MQSRTHVKKKERATIVQTKRKDIITHRAAIKRNTARETWIERDGCILTRGCAPLRSGQQPSDVALITLISPARARAHPRHINSRGGGRDAAAELRTVNNCAGAGGTPRP